MSDDGFEDALLEDPERRALVEDYIRFLKEKGEVDHARQVVDALEWPPLFRLLEDDES